MGLAAGVSTAEHVVILDTERAVHDFLHTQVSLVLEDGISLQRIFTVALQRQVFL